MDEESGRRGMILFGFIGRPTAMSQSIIRTNYPVVGKAALDCHSGTMSGHFRDVFCIRGIGSQRNADTRPTTPFPDSSLRGWIYIYIHTCMYTCRRGKAKEQDEDEGRKKRVAMTRDERKRNEEAR